MKNKGFSLIELIVVVALVSISLSVLTMNISSIFGFGLKQSVKELSSMISECRVSSLTRAGAVYLKIYKEDAAYHVAYFEDGASASDEIIGKKSTHISYCTGKTPDSMSAAAEVTDSEPIYIAFDKQTGAFKSIDQAKVLAGETPHLEDSGNYYQKIIIASGEKSNNIILVSGTGKHYVD